MRVNRAVAKPGQSVDPARDVITLHGRRVDPDTANAATLILNKPAGVVTTMRDDRGRPTVAQLLPHAPRLFPIGRLDADTTGLLVCTNDGRLAQSLMHPSSQIPRTYRVRVAGCLTQDAKEALEARSVRPEPDNATTFEITLREGKNRQVRRACAQQGLRVIALTRTGFGPLRLGDLKVGKTRALTPSEREQLARLLKGG